MNRRSFLSMFAAAAILDPERLLWVPGKKTIFLPSPVQADPQIDTLELWIADIGGKYRLVHTQPISHANPSVFAVPAFTHGRVKYRGNTIAMSSHYAESDQVLVLFSALPVS